MYVKSDVKVHLLLFGAVVSNGLNYSISKIVMNGYIHPSGIILIRIVCTAAFFWILSLLLGIDEKVEPKDYKRLVMCSLLGISCNQLLFYNGLNLTTPINAAVMSLMTPIIIFLITHFIAKEKSTWWQIFGVGMAAIGAGMLLFGRGVSFEEQTLMGDFLILGNSTVYAIFVVLVAPLMRKYNSITVMKLVFTFAIPIVLPFSYGRFMDVDWAQMPLVPWLSLGFVVLFGTIFNYYVNTWSLKHVSASVNGAYIYMVPFATTIFAVILGSDVLTMEKVFLGIIIFIGVYLVGMKGIDPHN